VAKKRILILGAGFGGVYVAVHLGKMLSLRELEETEIALVMMRKAAALVREDFPPTNSAR
jgi:NADH dehydrogenase FAD-containing subunit